MPRSDREHRKWFSIQVQKALHGWVFSVLAVLPIVFFATTTLLVLSEIDLSGGHLVAGITFTYVAYLFVGTVIVGCSSLLLGVPTYLLLSYFSKAHLTWMMSAGFVGGCLVRILWLGLPEVDVGLDEIQHTLLIFATPGGLAAAAFWYGAEQHFDT